MASVSQLRRMMQMATPHRETVTDDDVASFMTDFPAPARVKAEFSPVQDLHGYDNPWPAGGGKNLLPPPETELSNSYYGSTVTWRTDGIVTVSGTPSSNYNSFVGVSLTLPAGTYVLSGCPSGGGSNKYRVQAFSGNANIAQDDGSGASFTLSEEKSVNVRLQIYTGAPASLTFKPMICLSSAANPTTFAPYENVCPITGWTEAEVTRQHAVCSGYSIAKTIEYYNTSRQTFPYDSLDPINQTILFTNGFLPGGIYITLYDQFKPNTQYSLVVAYSNTGNNNSLIFNYSDGTVDNIMLSNSSGAKSSAIFTSAAGKTITSFQLSYYYANVTTMYYAESGLFEGVVGAADVGNVIQNISITFPDSAGTVYGGYFQLNEDGSGVLVAEWTEADMGTLNWTLRNSGVTRQAWWVTVSDMKYVSNGSPTAPPLKSDRFRTVIPDSTWLPYMITQWNQDSADHLVCCVEPGAYASAAAFKAAMSGVQLVYELATPITYPLSASQIRTLLGVNNVWTSLNGSVTVGYFKHG